MLNNLLRFSKFVTDKTWGSNPNLPDSKNVSTCFNPGAIMAVEMTESTQPHLFLEVVKGSSTNI